MVGRKRGKEIVYHILVAFGALVMVYPLLWMALSSFKPTDMVLPTADQLIPTTWTLDNYTRGWKGFMGYSFGTFFANSFFISLVSTFGTLLSSAFVAYALQRLKFRLRKLLFVLVLSTMMLPAQILMIPQFMWYRHLNWVGTYYPMILPYFFAIQGFFVYLIMNFIGGIPKSLDEAARIDGMKEFQIYSRIIAPLAKPAFVTLGIFHFMNNWNDLLYPMMLTSSVEMRTLSAGLAVLVGSNSIKFGPTLAATVISIAPLLILFLFGQRFFMEGIATSGMKE